MLNVINICDLHWKSQTNKLHENKIIIIIIIIIIISIVAVVSIDVGASGFDLVSKL